MCSPMVTSSSSLRTTYSRQKPYDYCCIHMDSRMLRALRLVDVWTNWPGHLESLKKKKIEDVFVCVCERERERAWFNCKSCKEKHIYLSVNHGAWTILARLFDCSWIYWSLTNTVKFVVPPNYINASLTHFCTIQSRLKSIFGLLT